MPSTLSSCRATSSVPAAQTSPVVFHLSIAIFCGARAGVVVILANGSEQDPRKQRRRDLDKAVSVETELLLADRSEV
jgi:hypothetical protein